MIHLVLVVLHLNIIVFPGVNSLTQTQGNTRVSGNTCYNPRGNVETIPVTRNARTTWSKDEYKEILKC